ncbi:MAG: hypothetical protein U9P00_00455 [Pseudomonadota bacterium]|nr:hypothetical protein [Pseudomonadota bacterium]
MKTITKPPLTLEEVADHFERWRSNKKKGERIPEALWFEAVGLVTDYPLSRVCRTLRLCATDLKKHQAVLSAGKELAVPRSERSFVEIDRAIVAQAMRPSATPVLVEMERPDGLRLRLQPANSADMLALMARFMEV